MSGSNNLKEELRLEIAATAERSGCDLLDVQFGGGVLRVVLDREEGVNLTHCETVSRELSALLDVEDFGLGRYVLEVTSPGLDRPLYGPEDYERFAGSMAKVTWTSETGKRTDLFRLEGVADGGESRAVVVLTDSSERMEIPFARIEAAHLEPEF